MLHKFKITFYLFILCLFGLTLMTLSPLFAQQNEGNANQQNQVNANQQNQVNANEALEEELSLVKTELAEAEKAGIKKDGEISKLNGNIKTILDSLYGLDAELVVKVQAHEKYKELIHCYRSALSNWDDFQRRQGLTEQDHLVIRIELRRSLLSCPPM